MLKVQEYLLSGKTLDNLHEELGIEIRLHESLPLVILNYNQIDSPKTNSIVKECRALVLEKDTWKIVARAFDRFFNLGEDLENAKNFRWDSFETTSKEDGSIILVYFYNDYWMVNSRGSFGNTECGMSGKTWDQLIRPMIAGNFTKMDTNITYVFEFVSIWNKIVRRYPKTDLYLLTMFNTLFDMEYDQDRADYVVGQFGWTRTTRFPFKSLDEIEVYLSELEKNDPTNEGVVVQDSNGMRLKIKNKAYLSLHRLYSNEAPTPKNLIQFVLAGEASELLTYFPEYEVEYRKVEEKVNTAFDGLVEIWEKNWHIEGQKEFAFAIVPKTRFTGILFDIRKEFGKEQTLEILKKKWRESDTLILKVLFGY